MSKILLIGPNSQGGITSVIKTLLVNGLDKKSAFLPSYVDGGILKNLLYYPLFLINLILKLIVSSDIKIIHIHGASRGSFTRKSLVVLISKIFNKKIIYHVHGAEFHIFYKNSPMLGKRYISFILDLSDKILVLSTKWQEFMRTVSSNKNIQVLYNPLEINEGVCPNNERPVFLFMGRLGKRKGAYDIIEACKLIENKNFEIHLYGDGELKKLQQLATEADLEDIVKVKGWISGDEKENAFKSADVLLLPSYNEGLPISVLEGMSYGLPVLSTPVGGTAEAVENEVNGFLIEPGDINSLAKKIQVLSGNKGLRQKMGEKGHIIAKEKFEIDIIIKKLDSIYTDLLNK